jgi:hypothetical protein
MPDEANLYLRLLYRRVFASQDPSLAQISFDASLLDRYRGHAGYTLVRTNSAGRIKREGAWSIDLGIAEDSTLHASLRDLMNNLPEAEREHWADHVVALPMSSSFVQMQLQPSSCFDDGELRPWG